MGETVSFNKSNYDYNEPVIVYGASVYGEIAYYALEEMGIKPSYFCDRAYQKQTYFEIPVIRLNDLKTMQNANIIIASADYFRDIRNDLNKIGCYNIFDMSELLKVEIPKGKLSNRAKEMYANKQHYIDVVGISKDYDALVFNRIQFVVSEMCSLKCKDCTHLMQYYQKPKNIDLELYKESFDLLLDTVSIIAELRILGGEPFMNKEMYKVIDWYHDSDKIQSISIYTNGTIIPDENNLRALQKEKVKVHISNYGINKEKVSKLIDVLKKYHIVYFERFYDAWQDAGNTDFRGHSKEHMQIIFSRCYERNCFTFLKGQLHRCPRSAHAMNIGAMPIIKEDYVDLIHWGGDKAGLSRQIKAFMDKTYVEACNYCDGPNNHMQNIQPAVQVKAPLPYKKITDVE